jgi:hypothetical protein
MKKNIAIYATLFIVIFSVANSLFYIIDANKQSEFEKEYILSSYYLDLNEKADVIYKAELDAAQAKGESYTTLGAMAAGAMTGFAVTSWSGPGAFIGAGIGSVAGLGVNLLGLGEYFGSLSAPSLESIKEELREAGHQERLIESEGYMEMGELRD